MAEHLLIGILIGMASGIVALIVISAFTLRRFEVDRATEASRLYRVVADLQRSCEQIEQSMAEDVAGTRRELETALRDARDESAHSARALRDEITGGLRGVQDVFGRGLGELTRLEKTQTDALAARFTELTATAVDALRDHPMPPLSHLAEAQERQLAAVAAELRGLAEVMDVRLAEARSQIDEGLGQIQADHRDNLEHARAEAVGHAKDLRNDLMESLKAQIEEIRSSVDQQLESTLERRIEERFTAVSERLQLVSERLEQVHRGLGDVQSFAAGLGNIQRALTNVRLGTTKTGSTQPTTPAQDAEGRSRAARRKPKALPATNDEAV
jgi:DNA recombination protein RmuC